VDRIDCGPEYTIVRTKNRFAAGYDSGQIASGYRDYQMLVEIDGGYLLEIQILPREMYEVKSKLGGAVAVETPGVAGGPITGHGAYKEYRAIKESKERRRRTSELAIEREFREADERAKDTKAITTEQSKGVSQQRVSVSAA